MTLEKWIERFYAYGNGGVIFDDDKRMELLFFLEELKEKRRTRKGGMTRTEDNAWYLCLGVMAGLIFTPVAYTVWWIAGICVLIVWALIRGREHE